MSPIVASILDAISTDWISDPRYASIIKSIFIVLVGFPLLYIVASLIAKVLKRNTSVHVSVLVKKIFFYSGSVLIVTTVLVELGFNLSAVLGAAGIASVAIGFAAQTSLSNIISGIFLYWERPFEIGDVIKVGDTLGIVISIDLMAVKLRSFDNQFIRIPNETLIKTQSTTITRYPIRRLTINIGVSYKEDPKKVVEVLTKIADENPYCLDEPAPLIVFDKFGESSLDFIFGPWVEKSEFIQLKNSIMQDIKTQFDAHGIEIPFPQRVVYMREENKVDFPDTDKPSE